jgi:hypothetical protein
MTLYVGMTNLFGRSQIRMNAIVLTSVSRGTHFALVLVSSARECVCIANP